MREDKSKINELVLIVGLVFVGPLLQVVLRPGKMPRRCHHSMGRPAKLFELSPCQLVSQTWGDETAIELFCGKGGQEEEWHL